ncbi:MAG: hypothetical protein WDA60_02470 [Acidimicrobiia bacterium]|jgi:hypothetical protein
MSTPSAPEPPDARDPRTAEWLAVEPLDRVTRARLVRSALATAGDASEEAPAAAPGRPRLARVLAIAAALLLVLVVGIAVLVPRSSDEPTPTAAHAPSAKRAAPDTAEAPASDSSRSSGATALEDAAPTPLPALGALGDVSTQALLRAAATALRDPAFADPSFVPPACAVEAGRSFGTPIAAGTGTVNGKPATVILVQRPDGLSGAIAVVNRTCRPASSVLFP